jgi:hypothetical protein
LNSEILKPRFHLEPIKQLLEKGCVSKYVEENMQSLMSRLVRFKKGRKNQARRMTKKEEK